MTTSLITPLEPFYVVDTHSLIWYLLNDKKLSPLAKEIFQFTEQNQTILIVSVIALAELYYANAKHKWFADFQIVYQDLNSKPFIHFVPVFQADILDFARDSDVPEMHDRLIAGLARRLGAPLLTSDPLIAAANVVTVLW